MKEQANGIFYPLLLSLPYRYRNLRSVKTKIRLRRFDNVLIVFISQEKRNLQA